MRRVKLFLLIALVVSTPLSSEIYKLALPSDLGMKFYWWPVLSKVEGWSHDRNGSIHFGVNAQAPDGYTFENAETVIYAKAAFKPRYPNVSSLKEFIEQDLKRFSKSSDIDIKEVDSISTENGIKLMSYQYFPRISGNWEQVSFGEEGEYYLIIAISSRSKKGFEESWVTYKRFINEYKM